MRNILILPGILLLICSCMTTAQRDMSDTLEKIASEVTTEPEPVRIEYQEKIVYIEKPVYVPLRETRESASEIQADESAGSIVKNSLSDATQTPEYWQGGMIFYDYDDTFAYDIFTRPLRITDIQLEPGEIILGQPVSGDSTRWILGSGVSYVNGIETQHIYLKPVKEGLETTLIINTNRRRYYLILFSFPDVFMMGVCWNYPRGSLPLQYPEQEYNGAGSGLIRPENLNFEYTVKYPEANPPAWVPERVYDDGVKTYLVFPVSVLTGDLPAVSLKNGDLVNFRVQKNIIILDRLISAITIKLNKLSVTVEKKDLKNE